MRRAERRRRRLSMTSLIDVIFLLLLFFMLSSTFSRFAEVELSSASAGEAVSSTTRPLFLQLSPNRISLNGTVMPLDGLATALRDRTSSSAETVPVLVSLGDDTTAQRLADLLVVMSAVDGVAPTILGSAR
ncbi:biopolymer transporter ExbD [Palleronia sp. LCG004]|uniref:biopolymer transporter ExbD n=1 Tax=Palleronia sp. LCG004 TaxID=3079304 RepID=UPI002942F4FA|nr:biopolymer transporter ExbD [Palleronia sp. LCG004]WOI55002.1 biopolymer transporter ExbD [Palleronia sp. LCG004]